MVNPKRAMQIHKQDNFICQYCGKDMLGSLDDWAQMAIDRFKGNHKVRLVTSCQLCNKIKGKKVFSNMQEASGCVITSRIRLYEACLKLRKKFIR
jgi:5-methylcytosine-specific restriction endonuclease McrA